MTAHGPETRFPSRATSPAAKFGVVSKRRGVHDERIASANWLTRLLRRPEAGAASGLIAALIIFAVPARRGGALFARKAR